MEDMHRPEISQSEPEIVRGKLELEPTSFELPVGVARIDVEETSVHIRYTPDWNEEAFFTNVRDLIETTGKPVTATFNGKQFIAFPGDDWNMIMIRSRIQSGPDTYPELTYYPPKRR